MSRIEESISKLKRFKYHAIGRLELEDAIDNVVSWYEQVMKSALHGWLDEDNEPPYDLNVVCEEKIPFGKFKHGDKVRIIVVKED